MEIVTQDYGDDGTDALFDRKLETATLSFCYLRYI